MPDHIDFIENLNANAQKFAQELPMGEIIGIEEDSFAQAVGIRPGDKLISVNGNPCEDVIDVRFYGAERELEIKILRGDEELTLSGMRQEGQWLGMEFAHPTFDIDIRRCNNLCPFCFVLQMGPRFRKTLYIKDDDYRYSFLFGHYVTLTNLSDHDWTRILNQRLSPLYVSVHATDPETRRACLRNPQAPDILEQLRILGEHRIEVHTQLVITPGLNDGPRLQQSIEDLADLYPTVASISVVPVGLTQFHKYGYQPATVEHATAVLDLVERYQERFLRDLGLRLVYCTDEYYLITGRRLPELDEYDDQMLHENGLGMVRAFLDEWEVIQTEEVPTLETDTQHITLVTGTLAAPVIEQAGNELGQQTGIQVDTIAVVNQKLGDTITVAGLLMAEDVQNTLAEQDNLGEFVVLPRIMFDHPDGVSLDDISPHQIAQALNRPIALADSMGDVIDALTGDNTLVFTPQMSLISPDDIMEDGGWSVEKYL